MDTPGLFKEAPSQRCWRALQGGEPYDSLSRRLQNRVIDTSRIISHFAEIVEEKLGPRDRLDTLRAAQKDNLRTEKKNIEADLESVRRSKIKSQIAKGKLEKLQKIATFYFPERDCLEYSIVDFGPHEATIQDNLKLGDWEKTVFAGKSEDALRWIHCPLGRGVVHSSIEDLFRHARKEGTKFEILGRPGWSYLEIDMLQLQDKTEVTDAHYVLSNFSEYPNIPQEAGRPSRETLESKFGKVVGYDMIWRQSVTKWGLDFWNLVKSDLPWLLNDQGVDYKDASGGELTDFKKEKMLVQAIQDYPRFKDSVLVVEPLRFFHSGDGYLLTLSSESGIDYVGRQYEDDVRNPRKWKNQDETTSAIRHLFKKFELSGKKQWPTKSIEWLMIYILTEVAVTPHDLWSGMEVSSLVRAYWTVMRDLDCEKEKKWEYDKTKEFVKKYANISDEISAIIELTKKKMRMLKSLKHAAAKIDNLEDEDSEGSDDDDNSEDDDDDSDENTDDSKSMSSKDEDENRPILTASARIKWAYKLLSEQMATFKTLQQHARRSYDTFSNVRTFEQMDIAIRTEQQDKNLLAINISTVIFLPLGLGASYFGMNLKGIQDSSWHQGLFFYITLPLAIVYWSGLYAFILYQKRKLEAR